MTTLPYYEKWETEVKNQGRLEGQRATLLDQLSARFGAVPSTIAAQVEAAGADALNRWIRRVLSAPTLEDVFASNGAP